MQSALPTMEQQSLNCDELVVNGVRSRKKHSELPNCPVCSCTVRPNELATHLAVELERLNKLNTCGNKRKWSGSPAGGGGGGGVAGPSSMELEVDVSGCTGGDVYQRVRTNRMRRLRARSRRASSSPPARGECPVCGVRMPVPRLQRHALRCLRRTGAASADGEHIPDTSSDDEGSIDVENDEAPAAEGAAEAEGGGFGAEYRWCGEWRVRAAALASPEARDATPVRRASCDTALVVDGDEDTELYGPAQYSPSRIAPDAEIAEGAPESNGRAGGGSAGAGGAEPERPPTEVARKPNGLVEASAETRIQALAARIRDLEARQSGGVENKCLICLGPYGSPAVSIQCWHVYCEVCWLESLRAKKICPQCNAITTTQHLRRIYM